MKKTLTIVLILLFVCGELFSQNNRILKHKHIDETGQNYVTDVTYYDGLGYPEQVIRVKGSPDMKNVIKPIVYDNVRRNNAKVYLPYVSANNTAVKETNPLSAQAAFYHSRFGAADGQYSYVENIFEHSPLNRILETYNVGKIYRDENKKSVNTYGTNSANEVLLMDVNSSNNSLTISGYYTPNTLFKNSTTNEDETTIITYTGKLGQIILTRSIDDNNQNVDTYNAYNNCGQLCWVISPEGSAYLITGNTYNTNNSMAEKYCYTYKYDWQKNMIERKMPGKDAEYMVYDKKSRLVLSQDGEMRQNNYWIYNVYDDTNNIIDKTLIQTMLTREEIQEKYYLESFSNDYKSLGKSRSIYIPFADSTFFYMSYPVENIRYYGEYYYDIQDSLAQGTYLKVMGFNFAGNLLPANAIQLNSNKNEIQDKNSYLSQNIQSGLLDINDNPDQGDNEDMEKIETTEMDEPDEPDEPDKPCDCDVPDVPDTPDTDIDAVFDVPLGMETCDPDTLYMTDMGLIKPQYLYFVDEIDNIKYYTIPAEYMYIAECLDSVNYYNYSIFEGVPENVAPLLWKNPSYLAFEPVSGVSTIADLDSVKVRHLKAYERVRVLDDNDVYVERAFYYDYMGRVIQTVEKNHLGQISRYSTKYDFVGNILAQHESHKTGSATADVKLTTFVYDVRGRLLSERTVINGSDTAKVEYKYNELGQQIAKIYDSNLIIDSTKYNIQGWITEKQAKNTENDNIFAMNLNYYNPAKPSAAPSYTGNITEWTWRHENLQENTYTFGYDKLSRLKESLMYIDNVQTNSFTEQGFTYDKNGNIKTLKRHGETDLIHDLTLEYSGNRLWTVNQTPAYWYDANGNMNKDYRKNLDFEYNLLNLPYQILQNDTVKATFTYIADGTKAGATDSAGNGFDYLGSLVYVKNNNIRTLESTGFGGGRINKTNNSYDINYFITDHLGSTRVIVDNAGNITAQYNYYPFGKQWEDANLMANTNRWNFSGKEKQTIRDLGWLDFSARMYANCEMPIFITQDPLAEKYYSISPYAYCANNPIRYIDPDGREIRFTYEWEKDKNGNYVINANGGYNLTGVTMHVTGKTINVSSNKSINMEKVTQRIADRIESSFSGKTDGVTFTTNVNLSIANSMDDVSASDHIFALADISDYQGNSVSGAANDFNGKVAFIDADYFSGLWDNSIGNTGTSTAGHEFGHLAGLKHSSDYFNIMRQGAGNSWFSLSTNVNGEQLSQIRKNYENGLLNRGSNYEFIRKVSPSSPGGMKTIKMPNRGLVRYLINY